MDKSQIFLIFLISFLAGVLVGSFFNISNFSAQAVILAAVVLVSLFWRRHSKIRNWKITLVSFGTIFLMLGILVFNQNAEVDKKLKNFNDTNFKPSIFGYVASDVEVLSDRQRFIFRAKRIEVPKYRIGVDENILITVPLYPRYEYGQFLEISPNLKSPQKFTTDSGTEFDYAAYLAKDDIFSLAYYPEIKITGLECSNFKKWECLKISLLEKIFRAKNSFKNSLNKVLPEPASSLADGLLLGSRENISEELRHAFNKTGTSHILAISGWNITIIGSLISAVLIFFMKRQKAFWVSIAAIFIFVILTGASASVVRAGIMGGLLLLAKNQGRFYGSVNAVVFAGAVMALFNPNVVRFDLGFQLSFLATLGIIFLSPYLNDKSVRWRIPEFFKIKENLVMTLSAQAAVLPLLIYNFHGFSILSIPANILILPAIPFLMLFGFLGGLAGFLWPFLGQAIALPALFLSKYVIFIVRLFS